MHHRIPIFYFSLFTIITLSLPALPTTPPLTQPLGDTATLDSSAGGRATINGSNAGAIAGGVIVVIIIALVTVAVAVAFLVLWFVLKHTFASTSSFYVLYTQEEAFNSDL